MKIARMKIALVEASHLELFISEALLSTNPTGLKHAVWTVSTRFCTD